MRAAQTAQMPLEREFLLVEGPLVARWPGSLVSRVLVAGCWTPSMPQCRSRPVPGRASFDGSGTTRLGSVYETIGLATRRTMTKTFRT